MLVYALSKWVNFYNTIFTTKQARENLAKTQYAQSIKLMPVLKLYTKTVGDVGDI